MRNIAGTLVQPRIIPDASADGDITEGLAHPLEVEESGEIGATRWLPRQLRPVEELEARVQGARVSQRLRAARLTTPLATRPRTLR